VTGAGGDGTSAEAPPPLGVAVLVALRALGSLAPVAAAVADGRLEALLRASLTRHCSTNGHGHDGHAPDPATAVLTACAYLAAGGREDAYLALRAARDYLPVGSATGPAVGAATDTALARLRRPAQPAVTSGVAHWLKRGSGR